jgi:glycerol-3-phosphate acyltransferase PlsY
METAWIIALAVAAYLLGACPFSVWIGKLALGKDIRQYGDGNPGSTNVIKAGSTFWGIVAMVADIVKGIPFILVARGIFGFSQVILYLIAFCAVLGHAYSPFLGFRGGKALAVFGGTVIAIPLWDMLISFTVLLFIGFLFIRNDSWTVIFSAAGSITYLMVTRANVYEIIFIICISLIFVIKHYRSLRAKPSNPARLWIWLRSRKRTT